jgi:hypothetical protein
MKRLVSCLVVLLAFPATAHAVSVDHFKVWDQGSRIHFRVDVCAGRGAKVLATSYLHSERGIAPTYSSDTSMRQSYACTTYGFTVADEYGEGVWEAWMRIVIHGRSYYSEHRFFEVS